MAIALILTIVGITLTIIGIKYTLKYGRRIKLTYIDEGCIPLFESIVKNIDRLEVMYKKEPVDPSLILIKGSFVNDGNVDIEETSIHEPVSMRLPDSYKWLQAKIVNSSPGVKTKYEIKDESILEFKWALLKENEFFSFNSLIKAPVDNKKGRDKEKNSNTAKNILKLISFSHRITNLRSIKKETMATFRGEAELPFPILFFGVRSYAYFYNDCRTSNANQLFTQRT